MPRVLLGYSAWVVVLLIADSHLFESHPYAELLMELTSIAAILCGVLVYRPARRSVWILIAAASAIFLVSDTVAHVIIGHDGPPGHVTAAELTGLLAYPVIAAALLLVMERQSPNLVWVSLIDVLIVLTGLGLLVWLLLIEPLLRHDKATAAYPSVAIAAALGDVLLLAILSRLLFPEPKRQPPALWLLAAGTVGMLCSDVYFGFLRFECASQPTTSCSVSLPNPNLGWLIGAALWGAAALSPSMAFLASPVGPVRITPPRRRFFLIVLVAVVAPAVLLVCAVARRTQYHVAIAVFAAVLMELLVVRLSLAVADSHRKMTTEQRLRRVGGQLAGATDTAQIVAAIMGAAEAFTREQPMIAAAAAHEDAVQAMTNEPGEAASTLVPEADPAGWVERRFGAVDHVLLTPPVDTGGLPHPASRPPPAFVLGVEGSQESLGRARPALEILVAQASLAVSRMALTREIARRDGEAYFRALVDNASDVILIVEKSGHVRYASPSAAEVLGCPDPVGRSLVSLCGEENAAWVDGVLTAPPDSDRYDGTVDWNLRRRGRGSLDLEVRCADLRADPTVRGVVLTLRNVTAQRRLERELRHHAYYDPLTGVGNRLKFTRRVELAIAASRAGGPPAAVLLLDVDNFRELNNVRGREVGDLVLVALADRIGEVAGEAEIGRLSGDTFAVLATAGAGDGAGDGDEDGHGADGTPLGERMVQELSRPLELNSGPVSVTVSVGIAEVCGQSRAEEVIRSADLALEAAKADGTQSLRHYEPSMLEARVEHLALREDLAAAIEAGEFVLHYQPVVDLRSGRIEAFEALVRWQHPVKGLIPPDRFIPVAEETGLIVPLGRWIMRQAARDAAGLQGAPPSDTGRRVKVAVNVSARQFSAPGLAGDLECALADGGVEPGMIIVELTESALIGRGEGRGADLDALKRLGFALAIDDFGTGYSSLSYLQDLPFDGLKIDKSFVAEITTSARRAELIRGIVRIADTLGLYVVGEGVETREQWELLAAAGCRFGQGYLFSRPVPFAAARQLLDSGGFAGISLEDFKGSRPPR